MTDKLGNVITFSHSNPTYYGSVEFTRLNSITDSVGRILTFNYTNNIGIGPWFTVTVTDPKVGSRNLQLKYFKKTTPTYTLNSYGNKVQISTEPYLWKFENAAGEVTEYCGYTDDNGNDTGGVLLGYTFNGKSPNRCFDSQISKHYVLTQILYPFSTTIFNYESITRNLGTEGFMYALRVTNKFDADYSLYGSNLQIDMGNLKNYTSYEWYSPYGYLDYTGYPSYSDPNLIPSSPILCRRVYDGGSNEYWYSNNTTLLQKPFLYLSFETFRKSDDGYTRITNVYSGFNSYKWAQTVEKTVTKLIVKIYSTILLT